MSCAVLQFAPVDFASSSSLKSPGVSTSQPGLVAMVVDSRLAYPITNYHHVSPCITVTLTKVPGGAFILEPWQHMTDCIVDLYKSLSLRWLLFL